MYLSDYDIVNIPSKQLREHIGYCSQTIQLFAGSVYENITAGIEDNNKIEKKTKTKTKKKLVHYEQFNK